MNASVTFWEAAAPAKLPTSHCLDETLLAYEYFVEHKTSDFTPYSETLHSFHKLKGCHQLELQVLQMGVSLLDPSRPRARLQILPTTLRSKTRNPMTSYSKASGVFPSWCG